MVRPPTKFRPGEQVEVVQLSGWKAGTVLTANRLGPARELYQVDVDGTTRTYRLDQVRKLVACARCSELEADNEGLKTTVRDLEARLSVALDELRKWVNVG